jgi:hypothetical protein
LEINKLLVPSPSEPITDGDGNITGYAQPNDVGVLSGIFKSFGDAPDGFSEELKEFTWSLGAEFMYDDSFALRAGYFNENELKGARKFFTLGAGFKYNVIDVDLSYLISAGRVINPLENTLRFSLDLQFWSRAVLSLSFCFFAKVSCLIFAIRIIKAPYERSHT